MILKDAFLFTSLLFASAAAAQHPNVLISSSGNPNEPAIHVNPKNTNQVVAGANIAGVYYSTDAGATWTTNTLTSTNGVWGDPCIKTDTNGAFYYFHLSNPSSGGSWIDRICCQKSTNGGATWNNGTYMGLNPPKDEDKHWVVVDKKTNVIYVTWTEFDVYGSAVSTDSSRILFSKSVDAGLTWSTPKRINKVNGDCIDSDNTVEGATPAVGPNGEVYVGWVGPAGLVFDRSLDGGTTWLNKDIFVSNVGGGWDYAIPGIYRANGLPFTVCDLSGGPNHGTIYINWSDQKNGAADTDVWLVKSTDQGSTWSTPVRVNQDAPGKQQFFCSMDIDQKTGYLWFTYYDRRNYTDNQTDVYVAFSKDGGVTFSDFKVSATPFLPNSGTFFGDYTNISAYNNVVRPIWTRLHGGALSVWTSLVNTVVTSDQVQDAIPYSLDQNYPNPFDESTMIAFKLRNNSRVSLKVVDMFGRDMAVLIDNVDYDYGKYTETFDAQRYNLSAGIYYFVLTVDGATTNRKMILAR